MEGSRYHHSACMSFCWALYMPIAIHVSGRLLMCSGGNLREDSINSPHIDGVNEMRDSVSPSVPASGGGQPQYGTAGHFVNETARRPGFDGDFIRYSSPPASSHSQGNRPQSSSSDEAEDSEFSDTTQFWTLFFQKLPADPQLERINQLELSKPAAGGETDEDAVKKKKRTATKASTETRTSVERGQPTGNLRTQHSTRKVTTDRTNKKGLRGITTTHVELPRIRGVNRTLFGLAGSALTGGALPAVVVTLWGIVELLISVGARATLRSFDPSPAANVKHLANEVEERRRKVRGNSRREEFSTL